MWGLMSCYQSNRFNNNARPKIPIKTLSLFKPFVIDKKIKRRIASRILSTNKEKWWTVSAFYSECDEIRENTDKMFSFKTVDEKLKFLDGINDYVMNLEQKYSDA